MIKRLVENHIEKGTRRQDKTRQNRTKHHTKQIRQEKMSLKTASQQSHTPDVKNGSRHWNKGPSKEGKKKRKKEMIQI
jgi:hypothetical protein